MATTIQTTTNITNAFDDKPLPIYGKGLAVRDYLYVIDHCIAIDLIIHKGKIGETYCIGGDSEKNGLEIADTILNLLGLGAQHISLASFLKIPLKLISLMCHTKEVVQDLSL